MRYSSLLALCAFMLCLNTPEVRGEILAVHTYDVMTHTALLPKPVASDNTFSLAATWWLPDWQNHMSKRGSTDEPGGGDKEQRCSDYGYQSACGSGQTGEYVFVTNTLSCYKNCRCTEDYKYTDSNCQPPYYPEGTACNDGSGNKYKDCKLDVEEACTGYTKDCPEGWRLEEEGRCKYDTDYGTCCNMCSGYDYDEIPDGYVSNGSCDSCEGKKYKIKENPCEGYTTCEYGAAVGAKTCKSGSTVKYSECKKCLYECTLSECPAHSVCRREDCTGLYCVTGCKDTAVDLDNYWCEGALRCWWQ